MVRSDQPYFRTVAPIDLRIRRSSSSSTPLQAGADIEPGFEPLPKSAFVMAELCNNDYETLQDLSHPSTGEATTYLD